ncbi:MAG: class I SAM-dependent methyltransferase [Candidatus Omnitrophota bacterium]|nr:class I SAM-dependent methyltransferase [Candidatus Omnitrophota bacterium]MDZ4241503.1 class I SAM-dependent methyltransferase [Candidatus Omnitrophota bacterium]
MNTSSGIKRELQQKWDREVKIAAARIAPKILGLDIQNLPISDYNKSYFSKTRQELSVHLHIHAFLLSLALAQHPHEPQDISILDYGGGWGMLSLLAKELGIGRVVYNDIYEISCADAKVIADAIGKPADQYVAGDIRALIDFFQTHRMPCNAVISNNVIEHIYDIDDFLKKIPLVSNDGLTVVLATDANVYNPLKKWILMKKQRTIENQDRVGGYGWKERDSLKSYLKARREMIAQHLADKGVALGDQEISRLAQVTRGKRGDDIKKCVDAYLRTSEFPGAPDHPTNTCDPYTGNWAEHLMDPFMLAGTLEADGFETKVVCGSHGPYKNFAIRQVDNMLNILMGVLPARIGLMAARYFVLYGHRAPGE